MNINKYKISGLKVTSVPHCTEVRLVSVTLDGFACGEPIGWCEDSELGNMSRGGETIVGLRINNEHYGECWGHALKQHLSRIFNNE